MLSPDDLSWGETVGCGGKIKVVLEPVQGELQELLVQASDRLSAGRGWSYSVKQLGEVLTII